MKKNAQAIGIITALMMVFLLNMMANAAEVGTIFPVLPPAPAVQSDRADCARPGYAGGTSACSTYEFDVGALSSYDPDDVVFEEVRGYTDPDFNEGALAPSPFDNRDFDDYNVVVVVNLYNVPARDGQAFERGQTIRVYDRNVGVRNNGGLRYYWKISSGMNGHNTPRGHFTPYAFSSRHRSSTYGGAPMNWAVFFVGGVATHETPRSNYSNLGAQASHGCVRHEAQRSQALFHLIGHSGFGWVQQISRGGTPVLDARNNNIPKTVEAYRTLIIVK